LQVKDAPEKQHHRRKTVPWWRAVQGGFGGAQDDNPLARRVAANAQRKQIVAQLRAFATSLTALTIAEEVGRMVRPELVEAVFEAELERVKRQVRASGARPAGRCRICSRRRR